MLHEPECGYGDPSAVTAGYAEAARRRYREDGLPELAPDTTLGNLLRPGERLVALREQTVLELFDGKPTPPPVGGRLYLTSERLLHSGTRQLHQLTPGSSARRAAALMSRWLKTSRRIGSTA